MLRPMSITRALITICLVMALVVFATWTARAETGPWTGPPSPARGQATEPVPPLPRPTFLYAGSCDDLDQIQWPLNDLMSPDGDDRGSDDTDRTEYSFTANVPLTIEQMLGGAFAVNVHESDEEMGNVIACGNIGGVADAVGQLVIGLKEQGGSDVTGIVVLSPSPANATMTYVSAFITGSGLGDEIGTINQEVPSAGTADPPVEDAPPANEPPPGADPPPVVNPPPDDDEGDDGVGDDDAGSDDGGGSDDLGGD